MRSQYRVRKVGVVASRSENEAAIEEIGGQLGEVVEALTRIVEALRLVGGEKADKALAKASKGSKSIFAGHFD